MEPRNFPQVHAPDREIYKTAKGGQHLKGQNPCAPFITHPLIVPSLLFFQTLVKMVQNLDRLFFLDVVGSIDSLAKQNRIWWLCNASWKQDPCSKMPGFDWTEFFLGVVLFGRLAKPKIVPYQIWQLCNSDAPWKQDSSSKQIKIKTEQKSDASLGTNSS